MELDDFSWDSDGLEYLEKVVDNKTDNKKDADGDIDMKSLFEENTDKSNDTVVNEPTDTDPVIDTSNDDSGDEKVKEVSYSSIFNDLKEYGIFEEDYEGEMDSNTFIDKIDNSIEARVTESIDNFMNRLGEDGKQLINFIKSGGTVSDYIRINSNRAGMPVNSVDSEESQESFLKFYYTNVEGMTDEEASETIDTLRDIDRLEKTAKNAFNIYERKMEKEKEAFLKQQDENFRRVQEQNKEFKDNVIKVISESDSIANVKLNKKDRDSLISYVTRPSVKTENGYVSKLQSDMSAALQDPKKLVIIAKLLQDDFDFTKIEMNADSKAVGKIKKKLNKVDILETYF